MSLNCVFLSRVCAVGVDAIDTARVPSSLLHYCTLFLAVSLPLVLFLFRCFSLILCTSLTRSFILNPSPSLPLARARAVSLSQCKKQRQ